MEPWSWWKLSHWREYVLKKTNFFPQDTENSDPFSASLCHIGGNTCRTRQAFFHRTCKVGSLFDCTLCSQQHSLTHLEQCWLMFVMFLHHHLVVFLNRCVYILLLRSRPNAPAQTLVERALRGGRGMDLWFRWGGRVRIMESVRL